METERERCHSLMDKSTDNKHFKSAVNTSFESPSHGRGRTHCVQSWNEIKYIPSLNTYFCLSAIPVHAAGCVRVNMCPCVCVCDPSLRCLMSADRCLICAFLSLKQTPAQWNVSAFGTHRDPRHRQAAQTRPGMQIGARQTWFCSYPSHRHLTQ